MRYQWLIFSIALLFSATAEAFHCASDDLGVPIVRNINEIEQDSYGIPGLSHITIAGSLMHGFKEVWNTDEHEDLQILVVISRPPVKVYIYDDWFMPHTAAKLKFPFLWDDKCYQELQAKDEL